MTKNTDCQGQEELQKKIREIGEIAFLDGLTPDHFAKATSKLSPDEFDLLQQMGLGLEKPLDKDHICNVLTQDEIEKLCYERRGKIPTYSWYQKHIGKHLDVDPLWLPPGLVEAQLKLSEEQSHGKRSYKNYLRRLEKTIKKGYMNKVVETKEITFT